MAAQFFGANVFGTYLNAGTCVWTLTDSSGNTLGTGTCNYQVTTQGNYQGIVPASLTSTLTEGGFYYLTFSFNQSGGNIDVETLNLLAQIRGPNN